MAGSRKQTCGIRRGNGAGHGGPRQGDGYGGPAKGAGSTKPQQKFNGQTNQQGHNGVTTADEGNRAAQWREQAAGLMDTLLEVALDPTRGPSQVKAIETFQNRVWGTPKATIEATVKTDPNDMTDEELAAIAARRAVR